MPVLVGCPTCDLVQRLAEPPSGTVAACARCGGKLGRRRRNSLARTVALSLAALVFYGPANLYPILEMDLYGAHSENTVWQGCVALYEHGDRLVALVVFVASIVTPALKLLGLLFLASMAAVGSRRWQRGRMRIFRLVEVVGPWAMLDVFLVAVLVALVKLGKLATVVPGPGLIAYTALVVLTLLATASFDPALIWQPRNART